MAPPSTIRPLSEELLIDLDHNCLVYKDEPIVLDRRVFDVLRLLYEKMPHFVSSRQILDTVWQENGEPVYVGENNVQQAIFRIRAKLDELGMSGSVFIEVKKNYGYRLVCKALKASLSLQGSAEQSRGTSRVASAARELSKEIERIALTEFRLIAIGISGMELWAYDFATPVRRSSQEELEWRLQRVDLSGSGDLGILATIRFRDPESLDTIYYFSSDGELKWTYEADPPLLNHEGKVFERAWRIRRTICVKSVNGHTVWAALANHAGWAGCVLSMDANGTASVRFANAGYVEDICSVTQEDNALVIACGENNDFERAFIALLGADDQSAHSPQGERLVYRYTNAPKGDPRKYILFPQTELIVARRKPYGHAQHVTPHLDGVIVEVETGGDGGHFRYHFSKTLKPRYVFPSGGHEFLHQALEDDEVITHAWLNCPELQGPLTIRVWEPDSGWYEQPIPWRDNPWKEIQHHVQ